jgi:iron uptake system EfeUOB component EfeO/EfeM
MLTAALLAPTASMAAATTQEPMHAYGAALIERLALGTERLSAAVTAGDLDAAKVAWIQARVGWERGETFLGELFPDYDERIDFWPDAERGFHAVEPILFSRGEVADAKELTDALVVSVDGLKQAFAETELSRQGLLNGTAGLVFEIGSEKAAGGESPFSETSLRDMQNNLIGVETTYALAFADDLRSADPKLHQRIRAQLLDLAEALDVDSLSRLDTARLAALSESLALSLSEAAGPLGLEPPQLGG